MKQKKQHVYLGFDLGASSGRSVVGLLADGRLSLKPLARFTNAYCELDGTLCENFLDLWSKIVGSMPACASAVIGAFSLIL